MTLDEIFENVLTDPTSGCWIWMGKWSDSGYGYTENGKPAYRAAYRAAKGDIARNAHIDHLCRLKCCVNPDHLEQVSKSENFRRRHVFGPSFKGIDFTIAPRAWDRPDEWGDNRISRLMQALGLTQTEVAHWLGMTRDTFELYVQSRRKVPPALYLLLEYLVERPEAKTWFVERLKKKEFHRNA